MDAEGSATSKFDGGNCNLRRVGILYDERMCKHHTPDGDHHPENPNRIRAIRNKLQSAGILQRYDNFLFFSLPFFIAVYLLYAACIVT